MGNRLGGAPATNRIALLFTGAMLPLDGCSPDGPTGPGDVPPLASPLAVHGENPRYFGLGDSAVYLTGSHTWNVLVDLDGLYPRLDYDAYLDFLEDRGHNFFRMWTYEHAALPLPQGDTVKIAPLPFLRTGPGLAMDGRPKFDLTRLDDSYFERLTDRVRRAAQRGFHVAVMLFNGAPIMGFDERAGQTASFTAFEGHPFHPRNNINALDGDPNGDGVGREVHTLGVQEITAIQEAYVRRVVDAVNEFDNVVFEISNESPKGSAAWQFRMTEVIRDHERTKPKRHLVGISAGWKGELPPADLLDSPADWIAPAAADYRADPPPAEGRKVIVNDTDHLGWQFLVNGNAKTQRDFVWTSFTRGLHTLFMDPYLNPIEGRNAPTASAPDPFYEPLRRNMGYTLSYARRMRLERMEPRPGLASSGFCLANPAADGAEYLVYVPGGGAVRVDLSGAAGELAVEWLDPTTGERRSGPSVQGGDERRLEAPFSGDAVVYLRGAGG